MARARRPRHNPAQLATPHHENVHHSRAQRAKQARPKAVDFMSEGPAHGRSSIACAEKTSGDDGRVDSNGDEEDMDAPRVAQWIDEEDLELHAQTDDASESNEEEEDDDDDDDDDRGAGEAEPARRLRSLEHDLSALPLGTLRSAQRSLAQAHALSDSDSDSEAPSKDDVRPSEDDDDDDPAPLPIKAKRPDEPSKPTRGPVKRPNKHAPVEVTSKRPVSRRRVVVDDKLPKPRDPRFTHAAGRCDQTKFKQRYEFLSGLHSDELATLRDHVKRARKLLANSPAHLRPDREQEVDRLERAVKKAESAVNLDNRERVELEALQTVKRAEKEKRKRGKAGWWMKRSEQKELLAKARLDATASVGGKQAVKKALEKKRRKIGQKEKKSRPFPQSEGAEWLNGKKRRPMGTDDSGRDRKRRRA